MISNNKEKILKTIKNKSLIFDIETSSHYSDGTPINIRTNFDDYVSNAKVKWFGAYSYKNNKQYYLDGNKDASIIINLLKTHSILIGFNSEEFDYPIIHNNGYLHDRVRYLNVDCMQILGRNTNRNKKGFAFKDRGYLMNYKFKKSSLRHMAEVMKLEIQKGDIDYKIFHKTEWTPEEISEIKKYLSGDVMVTKGMFDKLWNYWTPFVEMLPDNSIKDLSWIRNSIASLTYKSACYFLNIEPTYSDSSIEKAKKEEMGGRVIMPRHEEVRNAWYVDFASLYPHIFCMFNLFNEKSNTNLWHGNKLFKTKGYYDISEKHLLATSVQQRLKERIHLKQTDPENPMIYTLKIFLNGLYGIVRSPIFEQVHTENAGWDCCWLGQQMHEFTEEMLDSFGFDTVYGDTDSCFIIARDEENNNKEYVKECLDNIITIIKDNVPFPVDTFDIDIETGHCLDYVMWPFSEEIVKDENGKSVKINKKIVKERKGKKKNYLYIYTNKKNEKEIKLVGLPIMKDNATKLSIKIYNEVLKDKILENKSAKFKKEFIKELLVEYLAKPEIMKLMAREYKVNSFDSYKSKSSLQAQISKCYFNNDEGSIELIKNVKIGNVGKTKLYCTVKEAIDNKLTVDDLDLEKVWNELDPFIEFIESKQKFDKPKVAKVLKTKKITKIDSSISSQKKDTVSIDKHENDMLYLNKEINSTKKSDSCLIEASKNDTITWD